MWSNPTNIGDVLRTDKYMIVCGEAGMGISIKGQHSQVLICIHTDRLRKTEAFSKHLSQCFEDALGF